MDKRAFLLAIGIMFLSVFIVYTYIEDKEKALNKRYGDMTPVVVAKVDIKELELIDESKVTIKNIPGGYVQNGAFKKIEELENTIATVPIIEGEQITKPRVSYPGTKSGLSRQVSVGMRAVAIRVDDSSAVSGLIKPGDRVDVLMKVDYGSGRKDLVDVRTVLEDALVLSTGLNVTNNLPVIGVQTPGVIKAMNLNTYSQFNTLTLELSPFDAQKIVYLITTLGASPYIILRNNNDKKQLRLQPVSLFDVLGDDAAKAKAFFLERYQVKR